MKPEHLAECYRLLEVSREASPEEIRKAYLLLANVWHPDRFQHSPDLSSLAQQKMRAINLAFESIQDAPLAPRAGGARDELYDVLDDDVADDEVGDAADSPQAAEPARSVAECVELGRRLTTGPGRMRTDADGLEWSGIPDFTQYVEGLRAFAEALRQDRKCFEAWYGLGRAHLGLGEFEPAIRALTEAVTLRPQCAEAWVSLGAAYASRDRQAEAADAFRHAVHAQPRDAAAWYALGIACTKLRRDDEAIEAYREVVRLSPDLAEGWCALGVALAFPGSERPVEPEQALAAFRNALRLRPDMADAWFRLGSTLSGLGRHEEAIEALQQAVRLQPESAEAWFSLGVAARYSSRPGASRMVRDAYWRLKGLDPAMASRLRELLPYATRLALLAIRPPSRGVIELG
jgi:tetratricopeptide (TPR) repeat protein